jgi:cold-inducible RNA-binding protein
MGTRLYVANLSYQTTESELEQHFQQCGTVSSVQIVMDRETNRSRGFGFITMGSDAEAQAAIESLNGQDLSGRELRVSEARPREERPPQQKRSFSDRGDRGGRPDRGGRGREERGGYDREDRERRY